MISWLGYPSTKTQKVINNDFRIIGFSAILAISAFFVFASDTEDIDLF